MKTEDGIICTRAELPQYLKEFHCKDEQDLRNCLNYEYGVDLVITDDNGTNTNNRH